MYLHLGCIKNVNPYSHFKICCFVIIYVYHVVVGFSTELCNLILQTNVAQRYKYLHKSTTAVIYA